MKEDPSDSASLVVDESSQLCLIKLDKRLAEAAPILGIPVEPI